ncbi:MAG: hypothetical protein ABIU18_06460 [Novosphingobium sp.]
MNQSTSEQAGHMPKSARRSALDRAIVASVIAMAAMNFVVLAQQLQASPLVTIAGKVASASLA